MAQATMTVIAALLKEVYSVRLQSQLNEEIVTTKRLESTSKGIVTTQTGGKYVDFPVKTGRNSGRGNRSENEQLPNAGSPSYAEPHVPLTHAYGVLRVTGQMLELAEENYQAFASSFREQMDDLKDGTKKDWERQVYQDGSGLMASVTADPGANQATVDNIQYLEVGDQIDIRTRSNGAAVISDRAITNIVETTYPAGIITYDGADGAVTANEGIYRMNNYAGGTLRELSGFGRIMSTTLVLHTLDPATTPKWKANVNANGGVNRALTEGLMISMCDAARRNGGKTSVIFGGLGVRRAYFNLLTQQRRYTDTKEFAGGFQGLAFNYGSEVPMVEVVDAPPNRMFGVDESKMKVFRNKPWHWGDSDGNILKWVSQFDAWTGFLKQYSELATTQRNAQWLLADLIEG